MNTQKPVIARRGTPQNRGVTKVAPVIDDMDDVDYEMEELDDGDVVITPPKPQARSLAEARKAAIEKANTNASKRAVPTSKPAPDGVVKEVAAQTKHIAPQAAVNDGVESISSHPVEAGDLLLRLIGRLDAGQALTLVRKSDDSWEIMTGTAIPPTMSAIVRKKFKMTLQEWEDEVFSGEYKTHLAAWQKLDEKGKLSLVKKAGVSWNESADPRVNLLNATMAYRTHLGLNGDNKYKPEYQEKAARDALR